VIRRFGHGLGALALLAFVHARQAHGFVRSTTGNAPFFWKESCVPITIYLNGFDAKSGMTSDQIVKSVTAAAHSWSADSVSCPSGDSPYLEIVPTLAPASATPPAVAWDARNTVIFRSPPDEWSKSGKPGHAYAPEALAVTTVTARSDGHIVDVDMEVNGVSQCWFNFDPGDVAPFMRGDPCPPFDLQNALTHEFGHFIGLDHTCFIASADNPAVGTDGKPRPNDDKGNAIPDCDSSPSDVEMTVMFNVTTSGETSKRTLSQDDKNAVCTIYASSIDHDACTLDSAAPGCAVAPSGPAPRGPSRWGPGLCGGALAALALFAARRRARR
jgi:hypothetical protein